MNEYRIICTNCGRDFKCDTAGVLVKELFQGNKEIYQIWSADLLRCPGCGITVISRFADKPIAEHWDKEKMAEALLLCDKKTLGKNLFEWREHTQVFKAPETKTATQGKPEDA